MNSEEYVLTWSHRENMFCVIKLEEFLSCGRHAYQENIHFDSVALLIGSRDECIKAGESSIGTLNARKAANA